MCSGVMSQQTANMSSENAETCLLLQIPAEILDRITWHLTTTELCDLRITCKAIEEALYFRFTAEFFTRKQFMVSEFSLKALIDISKSRLSGSLRHVHIGLDQIDATGNIRMDTPVEAMRLYRQRLTEQGTLWSLGLVPKYLAEAFASLPNLETVVLRDFNSNRRSRDGPYAHWLSYGTQTMLKETQVRPRPLSVPGWNNPAQQDNASRLFKAIIHALGMANASPAAIEVMERQGNLLYDSSFHIHQDFEDAVVPVLRGLKRLHLCLDVAEVALNMPTNSSQPYHQFHLAKFLRYCGALEELRLNGKRGSYTNGARISLRQLFDWLTAAELTPATETGTTSSSGKGAASSLPLQDSTLASDRISLQPTRLAQLTNISLGMMALSANEIVSLVAKFADTLQHLELWRIHLLSDDPSNDESLIDGRVILFATLLKRLLKIPNLNLRHIKLGHLQQVLYPAGGHVLVQDIDFKADAKTRDADVFSGAERTTKDLAYTGSDWRHFVRHEMIPRMYSPSHHMDLKGKGFSSFFLFLLAAAASIPLLLLIIP